MPLKTLDPEYFNTQQDPAPEARSREEAVAPPLRPPGKLQEDQGIANRNSLGSSRVDLRPLA